MPENNVVKWGLVPDDNVTGASGGIIWREVGQRIREARIAKGLTQPGLAVAISPVGDRPTSNVTVSNFETQGKPIQLDRIEAIAAATGRSARWLLFGDVVPLDVHTIIARAKADAIEEATVLLNDLRERALRGSVVAPLEFEIRRVAEQPPPAYPAPSKRLLDDVEAAVELDREKSAQSSPAESAAPRRKKGKGRGK